MLLVIKHAGSRGQCQKWMFTGCWCGVFVRDVNVLFSDSMLACKKFDKLLSLLTLKMNNLLLTHNAGKLSTLSFFFCQMI